MTLLWSFLIYWLVLFVACYIIVEFGQNYLYDETTPRAGLKVAGGTLLLAALLCWTRTSFDTMFTVEFGRTVLQAIAWFAVFTLIFQFQPVHGAVLGIVSMLIVASVATLAVDSLTNPPPEAAMQIRTPSKPVRRPSGPLPPSGMSPPAAPPAPAAPVNPGGPPAPTPGP